MEILSLACVLATVLLPGKTDVVVAPKSGKGLGYYKWSTISKDLDDLECFGTMVVPER